LGIQTASFVAVLATAGLAIGLALQGSLSNFAAGVLMIIFRPFKLKQGTFALLTNGNIINFSANPTRRVDMVVGVSYEDDLRGGKQLLQDIVSQEPRVLKEPAPVVAVSELGDSSVNFVVRP
jgi:small conductance mechanosensitive channel